MWRSMQRLTQACAMDTISAGTVSVSMAAALKKATGMRELCIRSGQVGKYRPPKPLPSCDEELERIPVPEGIPTDKASFYTVRDTGKAMKTIPGLDSMFAVHGPAEHWAPYGQVEGHGACGGVFAVISNAERQYKLSEGDILYTDRVKGEVNTTHIFDDVLLLASVDWSWFGRPLIKDAFVVATIEEQSRSGKIYITKFKKRTGYRRRQGHRQPITRFRIDEIHFKMPHSDQFDPFVPSLGPLVPEANFDFKM